MALIDPSPMRRRISYFPSRVPASRGRVASDPTGPQFSIIRATSEYLLSRESFLFTKSTKARFSDKGGRSKTRSDMNFHSRSDLPLILCCAGLLMSLAGCGTPTTLESDAGQGGGRASGGANGTGGTTGAGGTTSSGGSTGAGGVKGSGGTLGSGGSGGSAGATGAAGTLGAAGSGGA